MKTVKQGETTKFRILFYDKEPAQGGVLTDPDNTFHTWSLVFSGDFDGSISDLELYEGGLFPSQSEFYFSLIDHGINFEIKGYSDSARLNEIVSTGTLSFGIFVAQALNEVGASGFSGKVSVTYAGGGGASKHWQIQNEPAGIAISVNLLKDGLWPVQDQYWMEFRAWGDGYDVNVFDDVTRLNKVIGTTRIPYGNIGAVAFVDLLLNGYSGDIDSFVPFPGAHEWQIINEPAGYVTACSLYLNGGWPLQDTFYWSIEDNRTNYRVVGYLSASDRLARINAVIATGFLSYTLQMGAIIFDLQSLGYSGILSVQYPFTFPIPPQWQIQGAGAPNISSVSFGSTPPVQNQYWGRVLDLGGGNAQIAMYMSFSDRDLDLNRVSESAITLFPITLPPGVQLLDNGFGLTGWVGIDYAGPGDLDFEIVWPSGINIDFEVYDPAFSGTFNEPFDIVIVETHAGVDFSIQDIGQTQPVYDIWNENNEQVVPETIFPVRVAMGTFEADYSAPIDAVPGENWRFVARGKIATVDTFYTVNFRMVDVVQALEEAAKLVTLSEMKIFLQIDNEASDLILDQLILGASEVIESYVGALYHVENKVELFDGEGRETLHVTPGPIKELIKVEERQGTSWSPVAIQNVMASDWFVQRIDGSAFSQGMRNWRLTYTAGVDRAETQIRLAVKMLVKFWFHTKDRTAILSDVVGGGLRVNYQEIINEMPQEIQAFLKRYRRFR